MATEPKAKYTSNQRKFIRDAESAGLDVDYAYSGRGMYGRTCPAVRVDSRNDIPTKARVNVDGMGKRVVVYAAE